MIHGVDLSGNYSNYKYVVPSIETPKHQFNQMVKVPKLANQGIKQ